jgi:hypothetical protein
MEEAETAVVGVVHKLEALLEEHLKSSVLKDRVEGFLRAVTRPNPRTAQHNLGHAVW